MRKAVRGKTECREKTRCCEKTEVKSDVYTSRMNGKRDTLRNKGAD